MIIEEEFLKNEKRFVKRYSDKGVKIQRQDGALYISATDPVEFKDERKYVETDIKIETEAERLRKSIEMAEAMGFRADKERAALLKFEARK